jgi:hypothetical protein
MTLLSVSTGRVQAKKAKKPGNMRRMSVTGPLRNRQEADPHVSPESSLLEPHVVLKSTWVDTVSATARYLFLTRITLIGNHELYSSANHHRDGFGIGRDSFETSRRLPDYKTARLIGPHVTCKMTSHGWVPHQLGTNAHS